MRPPPFILVRKSNVPGPGETAGYRDETMFFREFNFGTRMEHMRLSGRRLLSSLVTHKGRIAAVFWFVGYTAALHPDRLTRGRTEAIQWDSPPWCVMHRSIFFFPQIKWAWASARKKAFGSRLRQAKRSACPTRGWVKSYLLPVAADGYRWSVTPWGEAIFLFYLLLLSFSSKTSKNCQNRPVPFL